MFPNPIIEVNLFGINISVHWFGVWVAIGILCAFTVLFQYTKKKQVDSRFVDFIFYNGIASIMVGFVSAALFQAVYNYIEHPELGFRFGEGITFIGGLIGGVLCFLIVYVIFSKKYEAKLSAVISILPCSILIAHAFGRIGCFFAGCCYGIETDSIFGITFPYLSHAVFPTQLYEAIFLLLIFGICSYLVMKKNYQDNMSLYLFTYGIFRFLIEFIRGDDRGEFLGGIVSPSQFWSLAMIIVAVLLYIISRRKNKNEDGQ